MNRTGSKHRIGVLAALATVVLLATACEPWEASNIAGFSPAAHHVRDSYTQDQGMATVYRSRPSGSEYRTFVYGGENVAKRLSDQGWTHLGDPDSLDGYIAYPYQYKTSDATVGKMFEVVTPHGRRFQYTHPLDSGEEYNNSFAAISPDGQWLVSGEWDVQDRLLVFPMPMLNHSVPSGNRSLAVASTIDLSEPVTQIQGCDFLDATHLICSVDDTQKRLIEVTLSSALSGSTVTGTVKSLGKLPQISTCKGSFESEGIDYDPVTDLLRVEVIRPGSCIYQTDEYVYRAKP